MPISLVLYLSQNRAVGVGEGEKTKIIAKKKKLSKCLGHRFDVLRAILKAGLNVSFFG